LNAAPFDEENIILKLINIGQNVWIASNVIILPEITIGDNAVITA